MCLSSWICMFWWFRWVLHINTYLLPALRAKQVSHLVVSGHVCVCAKTENCSSEIDVTWYEYCVMYSLVIYLTSTFDLEELLSHIFDTKWLLRFWCNSACLSWFLKVNKSGHIDLNLWPWEQNWLQHAGLVLHSYSLIITLFFKIISVDLFVVCQKSWLSTSASNRHLKKVHCWLWYVQNDSM